jgi:hypothetical protein
MRGKRVSFFAEEQDLRQLITAFEAKTPCHYYEDRALLSDQIPTYASLLAIPQLGTVQHGDWNHALRLRVLPLEVPLLVRSVAQRAGGVHYFIDNHEGFNLTLGGVFQLGILVASTASTLATDATSLTLFGNFMKLVKKQPRIGVFYLGMQAHSHLQEGWRLVTNTSSPAEYDLTRQ